MRKPSRRVRTEPAPGADPAPAGGESAPSPSELRLVELDDDAPAVLDDDASLDTTSLLEAERPPHYA
ncbi:hypothetical protein USB125703_00262 [Pseudoclavibacter triregionum]|nr:hypothetical protein USB125703_00262 [Pseudoclavibacter triregionum]